MRALIQRVDSASVSIEGQKPREINQGYVILLGIGHDDTQELAQKLWEKIYKLRLFEDQAGKTNLCLQEVGGSVLLVSQFTLYADCKKGNRPSFTKAGSPNSACELYEYFASLVRQSGVEIQTGWFGEMMKVSLVNDGPFTIWLDTESLGWEK